MLAFNFSSIFLYFFEHINNNYFDIFVTFQHLVAIESVDCFLPTPRMGYTFLFLVLQFLVKNLTFWIIYFNFSQFSFPPSDNCYFDVLFFL